LSRNKPKTTGVAVVRGGGKEGKCHKVKGMKGEKIGYENHLKGELIFLALRKRGGGGGGT